MNIILINFINQSKFFLLFFFIISFMNFFKKKKEINPSRNKQSKIFKIPFLIIKYY